MAKNDPDQERGLYRKYIVERLDDVEGKHDDCFMFVLDLHHDPHAIVAIKAYIESCKDDYPKLADDLRATLLGMVMN